MPSRALALFRTHLLQQVDRGATHVQLGESALNCLWPRPVRTPAPPKGASSPAPTVQPVAAPRFQSEMRAPATPPEIARPVALQSTTPRPAAAPPSEARVAEPPSSPVVQEDTSTLPREERLKRIADRAEASPAKAMPTLRKTMVFAVGDPHASIMFIGEAPGAEEEKQREPFVGPAGQLLTKIIQAMGLKRSEVYISNICKYRPMIGEANTQGSRNRPPTLEEMQVCRPFILEEIQIIQPKIIVALGATASTGLGMEGTVSKLRGAIRDFNGSPVIVTYHPSYLLRREDEDGKGLKEKRLVWEDMLLVMEHLGLPISAKQRAYFSRAG